MTQQPKMFRNPFTEMTAPSNNVTSTNAFPNSTPLPPAAPAPPAKNITVEVSGSRFCIVPSLFQHIQKLNWKKNGDSLKLHANPDVFEMILQYFLFASLPDVDALSSRKATELVDLVSPLDTQAVKRLVEHVETFLANKKSSSSSSFLRRRLPSLSSMSSRNKASSSIQVKKSKSNDSNKEQKLSVTKEAGMNEITCTKVPAQINANPTENKAPPLPQQVDIQQKQQRQSQNIYRSSISSLPTSVVRSSSSSSDGSISRLSQPSYFGGSVRTQDENYNYSNTLTLTENDMLVDNLPVLSPRNLNSSQTMFPRMTMSFDKPTEIHQPTESTLFAEKSFNAQTPPMPQQDLVNNDTSSENQNDVENNPVATMKDKKKTKKSKPFFRKVFGGDRNPRKMTHAEWCSSEYVL